MSVTNEDLENYNQKTADIFSNLSKIAKELETMAFAKSANSDNPRFIELLNKHKELTDRGEKLHTEMLSKLAAKAEK